MHNAIRTARKSARNIRAAYRAGLRTGNRSVPVAPVRVIVGAQA